METKVCFSCKSQKTITEFQKDAQKGDGWRSWCRPCRKIKERQYKAGWKEKREGLPIIIGKMCPACKFWKPVKDFFKDASRPDGFHAYCSVCLKQRAYAARDLTKKRYRFSAYGLTHEAYTDLVNSQDGKCAICKIEPGEIRFHIDHCHTTGEVRGILCINCNRALGCFRDDTDLLSAAISYLNRARAKSLLIHATITQPSVSPIM